MRTIIIALAVACLAAPALAQAPADMHAPGCRSADLDVSIKACTDLIGSGKQTDADLAMAYNIRGHDYVAKQLYDLAIPDFDKSIALNPNFAHAYNTRGRAEAAQGKYDLAIVDFTKSMSMDSKFAEIPYNRGLAYESKADREAAIADYRAALKLMPGMQDALDGLGRLHATP